MEGERPEPTGTTATDLEPGMVVALFGTHKPSGKKYLVYGEVVRVDAGKEIVLAQTIMEDKNQERRIKLGEWEILGVMEFASWDSKRIFKEYKDGAEQDRQGDGGSTAKERHGEDGKV